MNLQKYFSGFSVFDYALCDPPPFVGKGWSITFEEFDVSHENCITNTINCDQHPKKSVVINAPSLDRAQFVVELLCASRCVQDGFLIISPCDLKPKLHLIDASNISQEKIKAGAVFPDFPLTCLIAAKASFRKEYQYALIKNMTSHEFISMEPMDLDPKEWLPSKFVSFSVEYQVRCAYAIVLAYSVIEELSFEVRANNQNNSFIKGKWNPVVKSELESRLKKNRINLKEDFLWVLRDTPTRIEHERQLIIQSKANWAFGKIRDVNIEVIDALARASWLRSKVSAHKLKELAGALNVYEVYNVQNLARRLLLEKMGFWRYKK